MAEILFLLKGFFSRKRPEICELVEILCRYHVLLSVLFLFLVGVIVGLDVVVAGGAVLLLLLVLLLMRLLVLCCCCCCCRDCAVVVAGVVVHVCVCW